MIVWLASYPRSGNTLLRIWLQKFFGLQSYSQYNDTTDIGADKALADTVGHVTFDGDWQAFKAQSEASDELVLVKTHDVPGDHGNNFDGKTIYVVRDGRSVAVSYLNYLNRFSQMEHDLADVVAGSVEFGNWADHLAAWEPKTRPDTLFLSYEDMLADSQAAIGKIAEFLGRKPLETAMPEFKELQKLKPEFFRSGSNSSNLAEIDPDDKAFMLAKFGPALKEYGYIKSVRYDKEAAARVERNHERKMVAIKRKLAEAADAGGSLTALETLIKRIDSLRSEQKAVSEAQGKRIDAHTVSLKAQGDRVESLWAEQKAVSEAHGQRINSLAKQADKIGELNQVLKSVVDQLSIDPSFSERIDGIKAQQKKDSVLQNERLWAIEFASSVFSEQVERGNVETIARLHAVDDKLTETLRETQEKLKSERLWAFEFANSVFSEQIEKSHSETVDRLHAVDDKLTETLRETQEKLKSERLWAFEFANSVFSEQIEKSHSETVDRLHAVDDKLTETLRETQEKLRAAELGLFAMTAEYDKAYAIAQQQNKVLQPSLKALLKMRAARYVWRLRNKLRAEGGSPPAALLKPSQRVLKSAGSTLPKQQPHAMAAPGSAVAAKPIPAGVSAMPEAGTVGDAKLVGEKMPLGIAVYTFDRHERVHDVLESLAQQNALDDVHVFIDGDQGKPKLREKLDRTEEFVRRYPVKAVHRNRGNFGFRKMMITSQRYMLERYDKIIFLEDDCFPTRNAVAEFSRELDAVRDNDTIFSVYGHPFKVKGEGPDFGRFQGWGWATTSDKLLPVWRELLDLYMLNEEEYLAFVDEHLTDSLLARLDLTPGRQPSHTIRNFFAWDEALAMICAMKGLTHKLADTRLIYNCGLGDDSAHFVENDVYLKPPFNMVHPRDVWDHF